MDILQTVTERMPSTLLPSAPVMKGYLEKWQLFLAPLMDPEIPESIAFNDSSWPRLGQELLISLLIYEALDMQMKAFIFSSTGGSSSSTSSTTGVSGMVKKVVTGPTEAEFFSPKETMSEVIKPGGLFYMNRDALCMLASRLNISLYICRDNNKVIIAPDIHKRPTLHRKTK